jgi:hypothetical protein
MSNGEGENKNKEIKIRKKVIPFSFHSSALLTLGLLGNERRLPFLSLSLRFMSLLCGGVLDNETRVFVIIKLPTKHPNTLRLPPSFPIYPARNKIQEI